MALKTAGAFAAGLVTGWVARSCVNSTRGLMVNSVSLSSRFVKHFRRVIAEQREWVEDLVAEGRAHHESQVQPIASDDANSPDVAWTNGSNHGEPS